MNTPTKAKKPKRFKRTSRLIKTLSGQNLFTRKRQPKAHIDSLDSKEPTSEIELSPGESDLLIDLEVSLATSEEKVETLREDISWKDFLEVKSGLLKGIRQEIKFNFSFKKNDIAMQAYPGCSMEFITHPLLSSKESLSNSEFEHIYRFYSEYKHNFDKQSIAWSDPRTTKLRIGENYKKLKQKSNSGFSLYDLVSADSFESSGKIYNVSEFITFPESEKNSFLPEFLVVNIMIPTYKPVNPLLYNRKSDGVGVNVVQIFKLSDWTLNNLTDPSVKLFMKFIEDCDEFSRTQNGKLVETVNRLKNIISILNQNDLGFGLVENNLFPKYNNTPWLIRHFLTNYTMGKNYFEIDIDYHKFKYTTLKLGHMIFTKVKKAIIDTALVIEAREDDEMPERVLCKLRFFHLSLEGSPKTDLKERKNLCIKKVNSTVELKVLQEVNVPNSPTLVDQKAASNPISNERRNLKMLILSIVSLLAVLIAFLVGRHV